MATTAPPWTGTFFNLPPARNPIQCPSGEKNGEAAFSVPARNKIREPSRERTASCGLPPDELARKTISVPSGEILGSSVAPRMASGPRSTLSRIKGRSGGFGALQKVQSDAANAAAITPATIQGSGRDLGET